MSPRGALLVSLTAILVLGAFAAWLLNIPMWAIGAFLAAGLLGVRRLFLRLSAGRARQKAEGPE